MASDYIKITGVGIALLVFVYAVTGDIIRSAATEAATKETIRSEARISEIIKMLDSNNQKDHDKIEQSINRMDSKLDRLIMKVK
jgi:hypothetical protein